MTDWTLQTMTRMIALDAGDARRTQHFTKVYAYCAYLGRLEGMSGDALQTLELAGLVHDIGIHLCEQKYGQSRGDLQEKEGPALAEKLLSEVGVPAEMRARVCFLVGHHHTYEGVEGLDWRILLEADYLVNALENGLARETIASALQTVFRTAGGTRVCREMFGLEADA